MPAGKRRSSQTTKMPPALASPPRAACVKVTWGWAAMSTATSVNGMECSSPLSGTMIS